MSIDLVQVIDADKAIIWENGTSDYVEDRTGTFYECNTNKSALVEYSKEFQKKK